MTTCFTTHSMESLPTRPGPQKSREWGSSAGTRVLRGCSEVEFQSKAACVTIHRISFLCKHISSDYKIYRKTISWKLVWYFATNWKSSKISILEKKLGLLRACTNFSYHLQKLQNTENPAGPDTYLTSLHWKFFMRWPSSMMMCFQGKQAMCLRSFMAIS